MARSLVTFVDAKYLKSVVSHGWKLGLHHRQHDHGKLYAIINCNTPLAESPTLGNSGQYSLGKLWWFPTEVCPTPNRNPLISQSCNKGVGEICHQLVENLNISERGPVHQQVVHFRKILACGGRGFLVFPHLFNGMTPPGVSEAIQAPHQPAEMAFTKILLH